MLRSIRTLLRWTEELGGELQPRPMPVQVRRGAPRAQGVCGCMPDCQSEGPGSTPGARSLEITYRCPSGRGPCLPSKRAGFDSRAVLESIYQGGEVWQRRRLLIVSPQVRILPLVPINQSSDLVRYASGKRGGCLPPKAGSIPVRTAATRFTPGYPNQQRTPAQTRCVAGANPVPGTDSDDGRVAQRQCGRVMSG